MKKALKSLTLVFLSVWMVTIYGCKKDEITTLSINTRSVSIITETTVETGGLVTSVGGSDIIARGVCWSTDKDPTVSDNLTTDGTGTGTFSSKITSLKPSTTYYIRAYATSNTGTSYGNEVTFTTPLTIYPGAAVFLSASFSIASKVYMGLGWANKEGYNPDDETLNYNDFWEWDQATNVWTRKADFPGYYYGSAVCFSIGTKGFIVSNRNHGSELWEYDPATNAWTQKAPLPTTGIDVGFSIGNKGYIGGPGVTDSIKVGSYYNYNYKNLFWEWDQATNVWTKKADFGGNARWSAVGFSIGNKGYIGTGYGIDGDKTLKDFWEWDQTTDVWTKKTDFGGDPRSGAIGFSIGNKGYLGTGAERGGKSLKDFWEWDQTTDLWTRRADFAGNARDGAVGLSIGEKGYIGTGRFNGRGIRDFWEYDPTIK